MRIVTMLLLAVLLSVNITEVSARGCKTKSTMDKHTSPKISHLRTKFRLKSLEKSGKGMVLFFVTKEWYSKGEDSIYLFKKNSAGEWNQLAEMPRVDIIKSGKIPQGPGYGQGTTVQKRDNLISTYYHTIEIGEGTHALAVCRFGPQVLNERQLNDDTWKFESIKVEAGKITSIGFTWNDAGHGFDNYLPISKDYRILYDKYFAKLKKYMVNPLVNKVAVSPLTQKKIVVKLDMDYKEKQMLDVPRVYLTKATLKPMLGKSYDGLISFNRLACHGSNNPLFGRFANKYTHTYYELEFAVDKPKTKKAICYDLVLDGHVNFDTPFNGKSEEEKFDDDVISLKRAVCISPEKRSQTIDLKVGRMKKQTWEVQKKK
jgi:hypothetical protein